MGMLVCKTFTDWSRVLSLKIFVDKCLYMLMSKLKDSSALLHSNVDVS